MKLRFAAVLAAALFAAAAAAAKEYPIGKPKMQNAMEIAAVYLQPIEMDPPGMMRPAAESDIHLEADVHAAKGSPYGLAEGDWVPFLVVKYQLTKVDGGQVIEGEMMPMIAKDGAHYGDNVKLAGPGKYRLVLKIAAGGGHGSFGRHTDKETGVKPWFAPFEVSYEFTFAGTGKKGGY